MAENKFLLDKEVLSYFQDKLLNYVFNDTQGKTFKYQITLPNPLKFNIDAGQTDYDFIKVVDSTEQTYKLPTSGTGGSNNHNLIDDVTAQKITGEKNFTKINVGTFIAETAIANVSLTASDIYIGPNKGNSSINFKATNNNITVDEGKNLRLEGAYNFGGDIPTSITIGGGGTTTFQSGSTCNIQGLVDASGSPSFNLNTTGLLLPSQFRSGVSNYYIDNNGYTPETNKDLTLETNRSSSIKALINKPKYIFETFNPIDGTDNVGDSQPGSPKLYLQIATSYSKYVQDCKNTSVSQDIPIYLGLNAVYDGSVIVVEGEYNPSSADATLKFNFPGLFTITLKPGDSSHSGIPKPPDNNYTIYISDSDYPTSGRIIYKYKLYLIQHITTGPKAIFDILLIYDYRGTSSNLAVNQNYFYKKNAVEYNSDGGAAYLMWLDGSSKMGLFTAKVTQSLSNVNTYIGIY